LNRRTQANLEQGMTLTDAAAAARGQFGELARVKKEMREVRMLNRQLTELGRNIIAGVIFWVLGFGLVQFGQRVIGTWQAADIGNLLSCVAGVFIALRLRARAVAYFLGGMAAFAISELAIHLTYGIRAAQGAPTHFAVMGAGVLGVVFGRFLRGPSRGFGSRVAESTGGTSDPPDARPVSLTPNKRVLGACVVGLALVTLGFAGGFLWRSGPFSAQPHKFYRVGEEGITSPVVVHEVKPKYTAEALHSKVTGTVVMECIVQPNGECFGAHVTKPLDPGLDREALNSLQSWRFQPGERYGKPVPVVVTVDIGFSLR